MQNLFLNYICKISAQIVMTLLFNTLNKSKSWILKAKIYAHQWPVKIITSTRNLIEIVLIQDYSLRYSADQAQPVVLTRFCVGREANTVSSIVFQRRIFVHCLFRLLRKDIFTLNAENNKLNLKKSFKL